MKNKILLFISLASLLLICSCRKEPKISDSISGHVYEEGSGYPVPGADVFLIAQAYGIWPETVVMAQTKADINGAFTIKNVQHEELTKHFLVAQSGDYYALDRPEDQTKYSVSETSSKMDIHLYRKAILKVRFINTGTGVSCEVNSKRQILYWIKNAINDTTCDLAVEAFVNNKIRLSPNTNGIKTSRDTLVYVLPFNQDTLISKY